MCPFVWALDISPFPRRVQLYKFYSIILLLCLFGTFFMLHFMLPSSHFLLSFRDFLINLTAEIKMVMSEVLTRILLHPHMLCQPLFRRVCSVTLITIKLQILHGKSENRSLRNHDCIPQFLSIFSVLSRFSFLY